MSPSDRFTHGLLYWIVGTSYIQVIYRLCTKGQLPIQRRLCPIFVRDVGSPSIHERFRGLTGSQRTPGIWGVTKLIKGNIKKLSHE